MGKSDGALHQRRAGRLQHRFEVLADLPGLRRDPALGELARLDVEAELTRREHPIADLDRLGQGHASRRHLRRVNHLPAHGRRVHRHVYGTSTILPWWPFSMTSAWARR